MLTESEDTKFLEAIRKKQFELAYTIVLPHFEALIRKIARIFAWQYDDQEDLVQEGLSALWSAVRKYDAGRGNGLAPFAASLIRSEMMRYRRENLGPVRTGSSRNVAKARRFLPKAVEEFRQIGLDPYGSAAIEYYKALFGIDSATAKALLENHHAGAHVAVPIAGIDADTESAHRELWMEGGQSDVERRVDNAKIRKSIDLWVHETHSGVRLDIAIEIVNSDLEPDDFRDIAIRYDISIARLHEFKRETFGFLKPMLVLDYEITAESF